MSINFVSCFIGLGGARQVCGRAQSLRFGWAVVVPPIVMMPRPLLPFSLLGQTYQYTEDLLSLERVGGAPLLPGRSVEGVLPVEAWDHFLSSHPDQRFAAFLRRGIAAGFRIGYDRSHALGRASGNFPSVSRHSEAAAKYIEGEAEVGRLFLASQPGDAHCNPVGLIPKSHQPGKFRLIVDLSAPLNRSVNDGIDSGLCSLSYASVDDAVRLGVRQGRVPLWQSWTSRPPTGTCQSTLMARVCWPLSGVTRFM